jgi:hypothetical protein
MTSLNERSLTLSPMESRLNGNSMISAKRTHEAIKNSSTVEKMITAEEKPQEIFLD